MDLFSQQLGTRGVVVAGGYGSAGGVSLGWSLGQAVSHTFSAPGTNLTAGIQQPDVVLLALNVRMLLDGPYDGGTGLMSDALRNQDLIPADEPNTDLGFVHAGIGGGESVLTGVFATSGPDAIVDWVFIELRDANNPTVVRSTRSALVQRDGDVVDTDGVSPLRISALPGNYHVAVHHRNHLPVMTAAPIPLASGSNVDFTAGATATFGTDARRQQGASWVLWCGDVTGDGVVNYAGAGNDRDPVLVAIGGLVPTAVLNGVYAEADVDMDGVIKYTGPNNDRDRILNTIGGSVPTAVRQQQLP
jgi:hypothetical protein